MAHPYHFNELHLHYVSYSIHCLNSEIALKHRIQCSVYTFSHRYWYTFRLSEFEVKMMTRITQNQSIN